MHAGAVTALRLPGRTGAAAPRRWYKPGGGDATRGRPVLRPGLLHRAAGRGEGDDGGPLRADGPPGDRALRAGAPPATERASEGHRRAARPRRSARPILRV